MKQLLFILAMAFTVSISAQTVKNVDASEFKKLIDEKKYILIDLRTPAEIEQKGFIKGSKHIDFLAEGAEEKIKKLDKNKKYLVYCAGGGRSGECAELMEKEGFKEVVNLERGFDDWRKKGFEVEKK